MTSSSSVLDFGRRVDDGSPPPPYASQDPINDLDDYSPSYRSHYSSYDPPQRRSYSTSHKKYKSHNSNKNAWCKPKPRPLNYPNNPKSIANRLSKIEPMVFDGLLGAVAGGIVGYFLSNSKRREDDVRRQSHRESTEPGLEDDVSGTSDGSSDSEFGVGHQDSRSRSRSGALKHQRLRKRVEGVLIGVTVGAALGVAEGRWRAKQNQTKQDWARERERRRMR